MIEIKNLQKWYGKTCALEDVSANIPDGCVFGVVGVNGAGKSTLPRLLAGVLRADAGEILCDGEPVFENEKIKRGIFFLPDEPYYGANTTGGQLAQLYSAFYPFSENVFRTWCANFSLDENAPLRNFSKGMKRQMFLSLALASRPKYLLLDEAFDGLDPGARLAFKRALIELGEETGCTAVIASHSLRELSDICTHFALIGGGKAVCGGDLHENLHNVHKFQAAFEREVSPHDFPFPCIKCDCTGRVATLVVQGDAEKTRQKIQALSPLFIEEIAVDFEEFFLLQTREKEER